jgi:ABC-2 type transport system permease protein
VNNGNLIKKIYLPRELFPVASVWVSAVHFFPQLVVLVIGCVVAGWHPDAFQLLAAVGGFAIVGFLATGLGLLFGAANVYFRDSENLVDMLLMVATWASPVMYSWTMVEAKLGPGLFALYQANPITVGVELFHYAFWYPTTDGSAAMPPNLFSLWLPVGMIISLVVLALGQLTFRRLEGRFAQEL